MSGQHRPHCVISPVVRTKTWGFQPLWKFVSYDVELSSNSSGNSTANFDDDIDTDSVVDYVFVDSFIQHGHRLNRQPKSGPSLRAGSGGGTWSSGHLKTRVPLALPKSAHQRRDSLSSIWSTSLPALSAGNHRTRVTIIPDEPELERSQSSSVMPSAAKPAPPPGSRPVVAPRIGAKKSAVKKVATESPAAGTELPLISVLKKPGASMNQQKSLKKVAFLENNY